MTSIIRKRMHFYAIGALCVCLVGGGLTLAQTKQLKSPASPAQVAGQDEDQANATGQTIVTAPNSSSSSYSVVIENKTTPDGKVIQKRKVWQNGQLIEEEEKTLDADEAQHGGVATIQLPNGQIAPGGLFSSEDDDDVLGSLNSSSPFEQLRIMEEQMRKQNERMRAQFDALRQQLSDPNAQLQGNFLQLGQAQPQPPVSKYWIGTSIEKIPDFLLAQLPIEEEQGVWIQFVAPNSPAAKAGLKRYDVLFKLGDDIITDPNQVSQLIEKYGTAKVPFEYYRKGKLEKGEINIEERPESAQNGRLFGSPIQSKNFRVVRPGLIVPSTELDSEGAQEDRSAENVEQTGETEPSPKETSGDNSSETPEKTNESETTEH